MSFHVHLGAPRMTFRVMAHYTSLQINSLIYKTWVFQTKKVKKKGFQTNTPLHFEIFRQSLGLVFKEFFGLQPIISTTKSYLTMKSYKINSVVYSMKDKYISTIWLIHLLKIYHLSNYFLKLVKGTSTRVERCENYWLINCVNMLWSYR